MKLVVFGGNGYVGSRVAAAALRMGLSVVSISRSGAPNKRGLNYKNVMQAAGSNERIEWVSADVFKPELYSKHLKGAAGVVSCIGAFGSNAFMEKMNGDANITAVSESVKAEVPRFVFISTVENTLPDAFLKGYFNGKRRAEDAVMDSFSGTGGCVVLRPSFVYGSREVVPGMCVPLGLLGEPLKLVLSQPVLSSLKHLPGMRAILTAPVSVDDVGAVAAAACVPADMLDTEGDTHPYSGIIGADDITRLAKTLKAESTAEFVRDQIAAMASDCGEKER